MLSSPWARKVVAVLGVLLAADLVLTVVGPHLPEPVRYPTREIQLGVERLDEQAAQGCIDLLVTGNSMAAADLQPQHLADALGLQRGVAAILPGSIADVDIDWMERISLPRAEPGTVVYVASPIMFFPREAAKAYGLSIYTRALATQRGWISDAHRWAVDHLPLIRYRTVLADPETLVDAARGDIPEHLVTEGPGFTIEPDGHVNYSGAWAQDPARLQAIGDAFDVVGDTWRIDWDQRDHLRDEIQALQDQGRQVVVVIPPVTDDLPPLFPEGADGYARYLQAARTVTQGTGAALVDLSTEPYPDELFYDTHHLNQRGSDRLTAEVVDALAGVATPSCASLGDPAEAEG